VRLRYYAQNLAQGYAQGIDMKVNGEFIKGVESWMSLSVMQTQEDIKNDFYYVRYNSDGDKIIPGYTNNNVAVDSSRVEPGYIPRPTDQRFNFAVFFPGLYSEVPKLSCKPKPGDRCAFAFWPAQLRALQRYFTYAPLPPCRHRFYQSAQKRREGTGTQKSIPPV
jgi:hypothetical protein